MKSPVSRPRFSSHSSIRSSVGGFVPRSLALLVGVGFAIGCSPASTGTTVVGTGGRAAGTGGGTNPGTGGGTNPGTGGSSNPGTGGGSTNPGTGGSSNTATGGSGNPGTGGGANPGTGGGANPGTGGGANPGTGGSGNPGTGGRIGSGGSGNPGTGGAPNPGGNPPGYWTYAQKMWAGCSWTGIDVVPGSSTTNMPPDFVSKLASEPYCVKGTVHADYMSVALLGFNLAEPAAGASCAYKPVNPNAEGPPAVTLTGSGIAVSFSKKAGSELRIQVQGPNGGKAGAVGAADRWCAKIAPSEGPVFIPYTSFRSMCWLQDASAGGTFNPAVNRVSAVVFLVPGATVPTPFDYCVGGFNTGTSAADAPPYTGTTGPIAGSIGGPGTTDEDFKRVKVSAGGKSYIIQNNNWGNPNTTNQTLQYSGNSFSITLPTGGSPGGGVPASYPSIYIGANGSHQMGPYWTRENDNLPRQVSAINTINSTFRYNRANGDYNASYDIWFSTMPPSTTSEYTDGLSGFVMIWLYKPANYSPIGGSPTRTNVTIPGAPGTWNVWVGPRGTPPLPNRPVVSYVATSTIMSFTNVNIKPFITDAAMHGIQSSWYLTDVFGGFEIWNGAGTTNLALQEFTAVVQ